MSKTTAKKKKMPMKDPAYAWSMSHAIASDESVHGLQILPAMIFTAIVIVLIRMYSYERDMSQFFWSAGNSDLIEFFSHYKVVFIVVAALLALFALLYRACTQSLAVKKSVLYFPMLAYAALVLLSYFFSSPSYKFFAWHGWNERFEGTYVLLCYIVMLFYIINSVNSEKNVKWILYPLAVFTALLSLLGISQYLDHDFFRTRIGQRLLVPNIATENGDMTWQLIDDAAARGERMLNFTFQNKEIYQTVYNINYVSFYLTLLIPLFGMLFIREQKPLKKTLWGILLLLILVNLIGSASSGGFLGMFFVVLVALVVLNKRLLKWWKSVLIVLLITAAVAGVTQERWLPEITNAVSGALNVSSQSDGPGLPDVPEAAPDATAAAETPAASDSPAASETPPAAPAYLDYFVNEGNTIRFSVNGNEAVITTDKEDPYNLAVADSDGNELALIDNAIQLSAEPGAPKNPAFSIEDPRFDAVRLIPATAQNDITAEITYYCLVKLENDDKTWPFALTDEGTFYHNDLGNLVRLEKIPAIGWSGNLGFGSGRGYIWSRTLPLMKETLFIGHGADTFILYFPHQDYVGKYNAGWNINLVVDKPHNLYMGSFVGTGGLSVLALLVLWLIYIVQSFRIYWREKYEDFCAAAGAGIFFGVCGFLVAGLVDDSSVSVMPLFYGLLGVGIAINMMLARRRKAASGQG
ncbi:MAG: O-antigen ligase family protein [Clostridiales Family XIII bacterium]|jgi:hypothetical protein|nr:O-antigen ligase family protein [Clostridiales Family XIII bacterium]